VNAVFSAAIVQACVIHLIRATLRYASRRYWDQLVGDLRRIYTAPTVEAAWAAFEELEEKWGKPYPAIPKLWRAAWQESTPFLTYDVEIRRVLLFTNAIWVFESSRQRQRPLPDPAGRPQDALPRHPRTPKSCVEGHEDLPGGGRENCPVTVTSCARDGHLAITGPGCSGQWTHSLTGQGLGQADAFPGGLTDVGVVRVCQ